MTNVIGVRFKKVGKMYYFDPQGLTIKTGQQVIVETTRGIECGYCAMGNMDVEDDRVVQPLKHVLRIATETDLEIARANEQHAREAFQIARKKIEEHKLDMHLVSVECTFDLNKILFYFTADGRVDFRDLVKDLAAVFHTRIELRQIGVRDEAKMLGGLGICGRELCCASYLEDFQPVSISMAKEQNLSLNPTKISGTCGRLMCCLKYEHDVYHELQKITPKNESLVETPEGRGTVLSTQMLRGICKVQLEDNPDEPRSFACSDCCVIRSGRAKKNAAPKNEIDPMNQPPLAAEADAPRQQKRRRPERRNSESAESRTEENVKQTAPTEAPAAKPEPARERNGVPRLVKAVASKSEPVRPAAPKPSEKPRLVMSAAAAAAVEAADAAEPSTAESTDTTEKKRHRRRRSNRGRRSADTPANE